MKRQNEILTGLLLIAALVIGVVGSIYLVRGGVDAGYPLYARFPWGAGLKPGQPILLAGVVAGSVGTVDYDPAGSVVVTLRMHDEYKVPIGSRTSSIAQGFFGDRAIAIEPPRGVTTWHASGDTIPVSAAGAQTDQIIATADSVARDIRGITVPLREQLVDSGGLRDLREVIRATSQLALQLNTVATEQSKAIATATASLNRTLAQLERTSRALDSASVDSIGDSAKRATANAAAVTDSLRQTVHA
nr:MlaD family protein [Gemmatimonadaceae bacterium]